MTLQDRSSRTAGPVIVRAPRGSGRPDCTCFAYPRGGLAVEFSAYQRAARETSQLRLGGPQGAIAPMLGLASETGSILNIYKKYLRDGIDLAANREFLREELGDLLWYAAAVATACGLDLEDIVQANLARTRDRYPRQHGEADRGG